MNRQPQQQIFKDSEAFPGHVPTENRRLVMAVVAIASSPVIVLAFSIMVLTHPRWITEGVMALGAIAFLLPCFFASYFLRIRNNLLAKAFGWMLIGEAIGMGSTLFFALLSHTGYINKMSVMEQSLIRVIMFNAAILSSLHMVKSVILIESLRPSAEQEWIPRNEYQE